MKHPHTHLPLLIFAFSVTLFVFVMYGYMYHTVEASLVKAIVARDAVVKEQSLKQQEKKLTEVYKNTAADRERLTSLFVSDTETISFIESIENFSQQTGSEVVISSLQSDNLEGQAVGTLGKIRVHVDVKGTWASVMRTLMLAELLPYKVSISGVAFDTSIVVGSEVPATPAAPAAPKISRQWTASFTVEATLIHNAVTQ